MQIYCAVDGKICVNPIAPAEDFALGLKLLSVSIKAQNNGAEIWKFSHTFFMSFSYLNGCKKMIEQYTIVAVVKREYKIIISIAKNFCII